MQQKSWFCPLLDIFGILSLTCAIVALGGAIWFVDVISESLLFKVFYACLAATLASFIVSRLTQLFRVIAHSPDPVQLRAHSAAEPAIAAPIAVVADGAEITDGRFSRAA